MRRSNRVGRLLLVGLGAAAIVVTFASNAAAVDITKKGSPGKVQLLKVEGDYPFQQLPTIVFPKHTVHRSRLAPHRAQIICSNLVIWEQVGYPYFNWTVTAQLIDSQPHTCARISRGSTYVQQEWDYGGLVPGIAYHAQEIVVWKKPSGRLLGKATYDFQNGDYQCLTTSCSSDYDRESGWGFIAFG